MTRDDDGDDRDGSDEMIRKERVVVNERMYGRSCIV